MKKLTDEQIKQIQSFLRSEAESPGRQEYRFGGSGASYDYGVEFYKRHLWKSCMSCGIAEFKELGKLVEAIDKLLHKEDFREREKNYRNHTVHGRVKSPAGFPEQLAPIFHDLLKEWKYTSTILVSDPLEGNAGRLMEAMREKYPNFVTRALMGRNPRTFHNIYLWTYFPNKIPNEEAA